MREGESKRIDLLGIQPFSLTILIKIGGINNKQKIKNSETFFSILLRNAEI